MAKDIPFKTMDLAKDNAKLRAELTELRALAKIVYDLVPQLKEEGANAFDGYFVTWHEIINSVGRAWDEMPSWQLSPNELIIDLIDERDELRANLSDRDAIVTKLPQFKDGPRGYIGDLAWRMIDGEMREGQIKPDEDRIGVRVDFCDHQDARDDRIRGVEECYSTKAAAEAARDGAKPEGKG